MIFGDEYNESEEDMDIDKEESRKKDKKIGCLHPFLTLKEKKGF